MKYFYPYVLLLALLSASAGLTAQTFTSQNGLLNEEYHSGGCVGVADMNNDGIDDIVILDLSQEVHIEYGNLDSDLSFDEVEYGSVSDANQWGMCLGDVGNDGHKDIFSGGSFDGTHFLSINSQEDYNYSDLAMGSMFMQGCNLADINNDGWLDAFACNDVAESRIWGNDQAGNLVPQNDWINMETIPESDNSGNYGSVWTDFDHDGDLDLYIAKCRQGVSNPTDPRRINALYVNDGNGNYTEEALDHGLVVYEQSWTSEFADIDNDGDFDCVLTNHSGTLMLLENDGNGNFTEITAESGLGFEGFFLQAIMKDFDNDGFVDLIYSGAYGTSGFYRNNGDQTFTEISDVFPHVDDMHSFGIGDFNKDGFLDVYSSYGNTYVNPDFSNEDILWMNDGNDNNYITFDLEGVVSNMDGVGATVKIYGDWGVQIREVRAGESYGITNSFHQHFGVGSATTVDSAIVSWPSGIETTLTELEVNQYYEVIESACIVEVEDISISGGEDSQICPGSSIELIAPDGADGYQWNNGSTEQSITVSEAGNYSAILFFEDECTALTNTVNVEIINEEAPAISVTGDLNFCEGGSVELMSSDSEDIIWSNDEMSATITVTEPGDYFVARESECGLIESEPVTVNVFEVPVPDFDDLEIGIGETATITNPNGNTLLWFDDVDATVPFYEGSSYTTPELTTDVTYWIEEVMTFEGGSQFGGRENNDGPGQYHENNGFYNTFDAYSDFTLKSVKVYANGSGNRVIQVVDDNGDVVEEGLFNIPNGESVVELNFEIPAGIGYGLRCNSNNPQLYRNGIGTDLNYPYEIGTVCAITGTNIESEDALSYYYFFYDWEIVSEVSCTSDRGEVNIFVVGINEIEDLENVSVYPNPTAENLNISFDLKSSSKLNISLHDQVGKKVKSAEMNDIRTGSNNIVVPVDELARGMYYLQFEINGQIATQKVIVQ